MPRIVTFGEIMGRLSTPGFKRYQQAMPGSMEMTFAGAEASVAASIAYLGGQAAFVTALPKHAIADACLMDLRSLGVDTRHIVRTETGRLGIYYLEKGVNQRAGNVIYDREGSAMSITPPQAYDWDAILADASWFLISGITPAISRNAAEVALVAVRAAVERGVPVACDMNYRSKLWQWEPSLAPRDLAARTMRELMPYVSMFLGGREDAAEMFGVRAAPGTTMDEQLDVARQIVAAYPRMTHIALTMRETISATHNNVGGCLYVGASDQAFYAPLRGDHYEPYPVTDIVDRLGGGDAFTAGILFALTTPALAAPERAISFATAAGCLAHSIEGDYNYTSRDEIEALAAGAATGRVRR
jgi:2-dehydro-3-deoxygluconokinase